MKKKKKNGIFYIILHSRHLYKWYHTHPNVVMYIMHLLSQVAYMYYMLYKVPRSIQWIIIWHFFKKEGEWVCMSREKVNQFMCHKHLHASQSWALSPFLLYQCFLSMFSKLNLHKDNSWFLCSLFDKALTMIVHAFTIHFIFYFIYHKNQPCSSQFTPYPSSPSLNSFVCHSKRRDANKSSYQNNQIIRFCITRIQKEFISYSRLFQTSFGSKAHLNRILLAMVSLFQLTSKKVGHTSEPLSNAFESKDGS